MSLGAIGGCTDSAAQAYRPDKALKPGEEKLNPVEEANRLAEKENSFDPSEVRDQRVNPTDNTAKAGPTQNLTQAAQVNELREDSGPKPDEPAEPRSNTQGYQAAEAGDQRFPNRGGVLDFQI